MTSRRSNPPHLVLASPLDLLLIMFLSLDFSTRLPVAPRPCPSTRLQIGARHPSQLSLQNTVLPIAVLPLVLDCWYLSMRLSSCFERSCSRRITVGVIRLFFLPGGNTLGQDGYHAKALTPSPLIPYVGVPGLDGREQIVQKSKACSWPPQLLCNEPADDVLSPTDGICARR